MAYICVTKTWQTLVLLYKVDNYVRLSQWSQLWQHETAVIVSGQPLRSETMFLQLRYCHYNLFITWFFFSGIFSMNRAIGEVSVARQLLRDVALRWIINPEIKIKPSLKTIEFIEQNWGYVKCTSFFVCRLVCSDCRNILFLVC